MNEKRKIHSQVLNKFNSLKGKEFTRFVGVFTNAEPDDYVEEKHHLLSSQRGVYVPRKYNLAYSIKIDTTRKSYDNKINYDHNKFSIKYYLPRDSKDMQKQRDIEALYKNFIEEVPLGIVLKKESGYEILGLGKIKYFFNDYIIIESFIHDDMNMIFSRAKDYMIQSSRVTEAKYLVNVRLMQSYFREEVLNYYKKKCIICHIDREEVLVASHIKPWSQSLDNERLDKYNGLSLCNNHDTLFDRGLISFDKENKLIASSKLTENQKSSLHINPGEKFSFASQTEVYLKYHRENLFVK